MTSEETNTNMLQFTSFLFGIVSSYAFYHREVILGNLFMLVYGFSVLNHSHGTDPRAYAGARSVQRLDQILANVTWVVIVYENFTVNSYIAWLCLMYIPVVYFTQITNSPYNIHLFCRRSRWHASLHYVAAAGTIVFLNKKITR